MKKPAIRPRGYTTVTASLAVTDVAATLAFLKSAFDADVQAQDRDEAPSFATVKLGNAMLFVTNGWAAHAHLPQMSTTPRSVSMHVYVEDVNIATEQAVAAGATLLSEPVDMYWGERTAALADPFGHIWTIGERIEVLTAADIAARRETTLNPK